MNEQPALRSDDEVAALNDELAGLNLEGHWRLLGLTEREPRPWAPPYLWKWSDIRRVLTRAGEVLGIEAAAARRTVRLCMPGLDEKWATRTIHASFQLVKPGEVAEAHRHSMGALRFVMEGRGAHTTVEGEKFLMEEGDLVITPGGTWHDHANESNGAMIWLDGHDAPLTLRLNAMFYDPYSSAQQPVVHPLGYSQARSGALKPVGLAPRAAGSAYIYKGADTLDLLRQMPSTDWHPYDGYALDYVDPLSRSYTLPSIACRAQRLPAGSKTAAQRHTTNRIVTVISGHGRTLAGETVLEWKKGDTFVIPGWTWFRHHAESDPDAFLFNMTDEPLLTALALMKSEYQDRKTA